MMDAVSAIARMGARPVGLIHIGSHEAEEFPIYEQAGLSPVVYVDALPTFITRIREKTAHRMDHVAVHAFCGAVDGEIVDFHVSSNDGASSSRLDFGRHLEEHPEVHWVDTVKVTSVRVDTLLSRLKDERPDLAWKNLDTLVLDVQGAELEVLQGADGILSNIQWIFTEVNSGNLYQGDCCLETLQAYLASAGFRMCQLEMNRHRWGDALFQRENGLGAADPRAALDRAVAVLREPESKLQSAREVADLYEHVGLACDQAGFSDWGEPAFETAAAIDLADAELQACWGGAMNGQEERKKLFAAIMSLAPGAPIVETGTFRGVTTKWFAENFDSEIFSCEINKRFHIQATKTLAAFANVRVELADSRSFLRDMTARLPRDALCIFYLDAHWRSDLPLLGEVAIIFASRIPSIVMIDDFEVPYDAGYQFDDYGEGKRLCLNLLSGLRPLGLSAYFPTAPAALETGARRGCCVLATHGVTLLDALPSLRAVEWSDWKIAELNARLQETQRNAVAASSPVLLGEIEKLRKILADRDEHVRALEQIISDRDGHIADLQQKIL